MREAADRSGFEKLTLDPVHHTATLARSGMLLDLGGIAKGYAADRSSYPPFEPKASAAPWWRPAATSPSATLRPDEPGWKIGVDSVDLPQANFTRVLWSFQTPRSPPRATPNSSSRSTAKRYSHIIDPKTHQALTRRISVTVAAPTGIDADSLATALCVLGAERGLELLKHYPGAEALFFTTDPEPHVHRIPEVS